MNNRIDSRLAALTDIIKRREIEHDTEIDDLSLSLYAFEDEMAALDEAGIEALAAEVDEDGKPLMTLEAARAFVAEWKERRGHRSPRLQRQIEQAFADKAAKGR